jgi:hypothetical protein
MKFGKGIYLLLGIMFVSVIIYACNVSDVITSDNFDKKKWKAMHGSLATQNPRVRMVSDLKANYLKPGMSQSEVEALLGYADRIKNHQYHYRLGMGELSVDYSYLTLIYDDDGRLRQILSAKS